uniref:Uncharacterized protein n=1 Tax=Anguilla anguilla TaxID=7936 RepID=A0A0E9UNC3_ANGAN
MLLGSIQMDCVNAPLFSNTQLTISLAT